MRKNINQPYIIRSLMALALLLMPLEIWAQKTVSLRWGSPNNAANFVEVTEWTMNWSGKYGDYPTLNNPNQVTVTYSSSATNVATIDANGLITPVAIGSTVITASYAGGDSAPCSASYTLTYADDRLSVEDLGFGFSSSTVNATYGDVAVNAPSLEMGKLAGAAITYSSSATGVATVNVSGQVMIAGAGTTVISASFAGDDNVKPGSASYTLTVAQKTVGLEWGTTAFTYDGNAHVPTATATGLVGSDACTVSVAGTQADAGSYTATASTLSNGNYVLPAANTTIFTIAKATSAVSTAPVARVLTYTGSAQELVTAGSATGGTMQYSLDGQTYTDAIPTGIDVGNYIVYYRVMGDKNHEDIVGGQVSVTIAKAASVSVTFATRLATATLGEYFASPKATVKPAGMTLVYASSDPNVARVDANTGEVTLVGAGTVMIRAKFNGSDNYEPASAYYTLTVEAPRPILEPIVKEVDYPLDEDTDFLNADGSEVDLSNTIVNNILFTLKNQDSPEGDGYDTEDHCIVINTVTLTSTVNALLASGVEPGSADYASQFTGLSFLVPAGEGYIIVTSQEAEGVYLMVKVGDNDPVAIHLAEMGDYSIPYKSDNLTIVRLWKGDTDAQSYVSTRGRKKMADVRVTKVSYKAISSNAIQCVHVDASEDHRWYDLNGQRISQPMKKGVYIHGKRKVVIK